MSNKEQSVAKALGGQSLWPTIYVLIYTFYTLAFSLSMSTILIRIGYISYYVMSVFYFFKIITQSSHSRFVKSLTLMVAIIFIYGILLIIQGSSSWLTTMPTTTFLVVHLESILPIYAFYFFGRNEKINPTWFALIFILFFLDAYLLYYHNRMMQFEKLLNADEGFINNTGYAWAALLPVIVFLDKKKFLQYISIALVMLFVMLCIKRGAIVISIVGIVYFIFKSMNKAKASQKVLILMISIILGYFILQLFNSLIESNDLFAMRFERTLEGDSSGRNDIYSFFLNYLFSAENGMHIFWGNGAFATVRLRGIEAHNDWLEYAIDMGILGLLVYAFFWVSVWKNYYFCSKNGVDNQVLLAMGMVIIMNFIRSFISMSFDNLFFFSAAVIGYTMAMADNLRYHKTI